jgi:hypothetical protein
MTPDEGLWGRIAALVGQRLPTDDGPGFWVEEVTDKHVAIKLVRNSKVRRIPKISLERAWALKQPDEPLLPSAVQKAGVSEYSPTFVAAIINAVS